jgi:hypothetical protein
VVRKVHSRTKLPELPLQNTAPDVAVAVVHFVLNVGNVTKPSMYAIESVKNLSGSNIKEHVTRMQRMKYAH